MPFPFSPAPRGPFDRGPPPSYRVGKMKRETRITSKGQVVIPKAVRDRMRWGSGTRLEVEATADGAVVLRAGPGPGNVESLLARLSGCLLPFAADPLDALEADHRRELEADERPESRRRR